MPPMYGDRFTGHLCATQVLALKTQAKLELQRRVGLAEGKDYQLLVFMGRMTHQKGCDIIAQVGTLTWLCHTLYISGSVPGTRTHAAPPHGHACPATVIFASTSRTLLMQTHGAM